MVLRVESAPAMNCLTTLASSAAGTGLSCTRRTSASRASRAGMNLCRVHDGAHAEQALVAGGVSPGVGGGDQSLFLAHLAKETGTAAVAQQRGENVQGGHVGMADIGDVPGEMKMGQFDGGFLDDFARGGLARFARAGPWGRGPWLWLWRRPAGFAPATSAGWMSPTTTRNMLLGT